MAKSKLSQRLKIQLDELKSSVTNDHTPIIFLLDNVSFNVDEVFDFQDPKERVIIGRIFPTSDIFKEGAFQIEIKLSSAYPLDPPKVHFITPIYHPNVDKNGKFHHELLLKTALWSNTTSLMDIVKTVVERIDIPDTDYLINPEIAEEYVQNRIEFNRKALEMVKNHSLSRN